MTTSTNNHIEHLSPFRIRRVGHMSLCLEPQRHNDCELRNSATGTVEKRKRDSSNALSPRCNMSPYTASGLSHLSHRPRSPNSPSASESRLVACRRSECRRSEYQRPSAAGERADEPCQRSKRQGHRVRAMRTGCVVL